MKVCKRCNIEKELDSFYTDKTSKDGKWHTCKHCSRSSIKNRAEELYLEGYRRCFMCKIEKPFNKFKRDKSRPDGLGYLCYSCGRAKSRTDYVNRLKSYILKRAEKSAKSRNLDFNLTLEDIVIPENCPLLEIPLNYDHINGRNGNSPSIDRIDNSLGYIKGNIWIISSKANTMKGNASFPELHIFSKNVNKYFPTV